MEPLASNVKLSLKVSERPTGSIETCLRRTLPLNTKGILILVWVS